MLSHLSDTPLPHMQNKKARLNVLITLKGESDLLGIDDRWPDFFLPLPLLCLPCLYPISLFFSNFTVL